MSHFSMVGRVDIISIQSLRFSFYLTTHSFSRCAIYTQLTIYLCLVVTPQQAPILQEPYLKEKTIQAKVQPRNHYIHWQTTGPLHSTVVIFSVANVAVKPGWNWRVASDLRTSFSLPPPRFFAALDAFCWGGGRRFLSAKSWCNDWFFVEEHIFSQYR